MARVSLALHEKQPRYGLRPQIAETLAPYIRMLVFIHDRDPDQWKHVAAMIENVHQLVGGGKRGRRQKTGD